MNLNLRRTFAASAASALILTGAACSSETEGEASPSSTTTSQETETSDSSPTSETEEPTETSEPSGPAGELTSSDDAFSFDPPTGYADAMGSISVASAVAAVYDEGDTGTFPTTIVVTTEPSQGLDLQTMADAIAGQVETGFNTTLTEADGFPLDSVDGEDLLAFTTGDYEQGGQTLTSAIVITMHEETTYAFIANTVPDSASGAGSALIELIESVQWA